MSNTQTGIERVLKSPSPHVQKLLMEEAGLTYQDLVYMSRWGAYAPRVAHLASLPVTARRKGSIARDTADRRVGEASQTTRHASP